MDALFLSVLYYSPSLPPRSGRPKKLLNTVGGPTDSLSNPGGILSDSMTFASLASGVNDGVIRDRYEHTFISAPGNKAFLQARREIVLPASP